MKSKSTHSDTETEKQEVTQCVNGKIPHGLGFQAFHKDGDQCRTIEEKTHRTINNE